MMATKTAPETLPTKEEYQAVYRDIRDVIDEMLQPLRERIERFVITWHDGRHERITYDDVGKLLELRLDLKGLESSLRDHRRGIGSLVDSLVYAMAEDGAPPSYPSRLTYSGEQLVEETNGRDA